MEQLWNFSCKKYIIIYWRSTLTPSISFPTPKIPRNPGSARRTLKNPLKISNFEQQNIPFHREIWKPALYVIKHAETFHWMKTSSSNESKRSLEFFACLDIWRTRAAAIRRRLGGGGGKGPKGPGAISSSREFGFSSFWWLVKLLETTISRYIYCWDTSETPVGLPPPPPEQPRWLSWGSRFTK